MQERIQKAVVAVAIGGVALVALEDEASAMWTLTILDDTGDCGAINELSFDGSKLHVAWVCEDAAGAKTIKTAKGPTSGGSFPKQTLGAGSDVDVGKSGQLVFLDGMSRLRFARAVSPGTGNCGTGSGWECETVTTTAVSDPHVSIDTSNKAHITYRSGTTLKYVKRNGINSYTAPLTIAMGAGGLGAVSSFIDASAASTPPHIAYNVASLAGYGAWVREVGESSSDLACNDSGCAIGALELNAYSKQPSLLIGNRYLTRSSSGTWNVTTYAASVEWATGLDSVLFPCITRGGPNGLILTCLDLLAGWTSTLVDAGQEAHASSLVIDPATGLRHITYYDADDEQLRLLREIDD